MKLKPENRKLTVKFGNRTRFKIHPDKRAHLNTDLERLKESLVQEGLARLQDPTLHPILRRAADDAASLAWVHPYPLLAFPVLLEEKGRAALVWARRQREIMERSQSIMVLAE